MKIHICTTDGISCVMCLSSVLCPRGKSLSSRTNLHNLQVLVLVFRPQVHHVLFLGPQCPIKLSRTPHSANSPLCIMNSVTVKNGVLTYIRYYLLISLRILKDQFTSPCPYPQALSPCPRAVSP